MRELVPRKLHKLDVNNEKIYTDNIRPPVVSLFFPLISTFSLAESSGSRPQGHF